MIKTIILDLDGPILEGCYRHYACYSRILIKFGYAPVSLESYWKMKRERMDRRQQLAASGAEAIYDKFLIAWQELIEQPEMLSLDQLQPGVLAKVRQWHEAGLCLILVTMRRYPERVYEQLFSFGLDVYFEHVIVCDYGLGGQGKAQRLKNIIPELQPERCLWIGDTEFDIDGSHALGSKILVVTCGLRTKTFFDSYHPDYLCENIEEVNLARIDGA